MSTPNNGLDIKLLGKEYRVACAPEEREGLEAAVAFLDARLTDIGAKTRSSGERLAVMAALNIAHELLTLKNATPAEAAALESASIQRRIDSIEAQLDAALEQHEQLF